MAPHLAPSSSTTRPAQSHSPPLPVVAERCAHRLSAAAAKRITVMLENEPDGSFFRVAVNGGGCSGFQYEFSIDTARQDDDLSFVSHDVEVVIDEISLELVDNAELDYVQDLMGAYFSVSNPNATASCGCGTSFSV